MVVYLFLSPLLMLFPLNPTPCINILRLSLCINVVLQLPKQLGLFTSLATSVAQRPRTDVSKCLAACMGSPKRTSTLQLDAAGYSETSVSNYQ